MSEPTNPGAGEGANVCEHVWSWVSPAGTSHGAEICVLCHQPNAAWLNEMHAAAVPPTESAPAAPAAVGGGLSGDEVDVVAYLIQEAEPNVTVAYIDRILAARERARDAAVEQVARFEALADSMEDEAAATPRSDPRRLTRYDAAARIRAALRGEQA